MRYPIIATVCILAVSLTLSVAHAAERSLATLLSELQQLDRLAQGHDQAIEAWQIIAKADAQEIPAILAGMRDDNPLANNWIRAAVDAIAERTLQDGQPLPTEALDAYLIDTKHSPRSRRLAFEWLTIADPTARDRWIPRLLDDPSLELRREAVAWKLEQAKSAQEQSKPAEAKAAYEVALRSARDLDQIQAATEALRKQGETVDLPTLFGFLTSWYLIAPFDNTDTKGFDVAYPPEDRIDLGASYEGKDQQVQWQQATTEDEYGKVDLNKLLAKHKGAIAYATTTFESDVERPVDIRLGCINGNKVWLNGELLMANHVYHAGDGIDQYTGRGTLKQGTNTILVKICQNEQTEEWAQSWEFQLRVCDELGTAVLSTDRQAQ
ncbi:MAG: hypothetical protein KDA92_18740 [Planctomycetales bacterium]|nr:hypothetical protein [Planctomycetales bacterium]